MMSSFKVSSSEPPAAGCMISYLLFPKKRVWSNHAVVYLACIPVSVGMHALCIIRYVALLHVLTNPTRAFREHIFCALWANLEHNEIVWKIIV